MFEVFKNAFAFIKSAIGIRDGINSTVLTTIDVPSIPTIKESPVIKSYIDGPLTGNTTVKKLAAAALTIANEKGYVKLPEKYSNPKSIAAIADKGVETVKLAHDVATGKVNADYVADYAVKKGAAMLKTVANGFIDKGVAVAATAVTTAITAVCPPAAVIAPVVVAGVKFVGEKVKQEVDKGIDKIAEAVKPVVRKAVETVKTVAIKTYNTVKKIGRKVLSWFGL